MALLVELTAIAIICTASLNYYPSIACHAFQSGAVVWHSSRGIRQPQFSSHLLHDASGNVEPSSLLQLYSDNNIIDFQSLMVMDVVLFSPKDDPNKLELGAVQENGNVAPLSTWTLESAYTSSTNDMMEFVVDEEDMFPGLSSELINVLKVLDGSIMSYGSRQVGGGKGPGNPHGEESEMIYYVDRGVVEGGYYSCEGSDEEDAGMMIDVVVNTDLEVLW